MSELRRDTAVSASERALSNTDATGGYLVPPLYLQEEFVNLSRAGRVTANVIGSRPLPPNTDAVNVPRMTSGTTVASQADLGTVSSTDAVFDLISADVLTLAGQQDVSRQVVDRSIPGVDEVIFSDLARAYHFNLDTAVLNSTTTNNKGLLQVSGTNSVTYTTSTPTLASLYAKIADAIQQIGTGIFMPATHIIIHPRRWAFCLASSDSNNRPLIVPTAQGPFASAGTTGGVVAEGPVGSIQGLPVYVDSNVPTTLGAGTNQDPIIIFAQPELYLWEDQGGPYLETFRDVLSGTLAVRFQLHNYWAQLHARRPKAISIILGSGLAAPSF
jgi:HK97 family phage major capsid protein